MEPAKRRAERTCLGCRQVLRQDKLIRFVLSPSGEILADYHRKLPGRGGYTCLKRECIRLAIERKQFERTFRTSAVHIDQLQVLESLKKQILDRVLNLLGMARKSSNAVSGSNSVITALGGKETFFLIFLATDISTGIGEKISRIAAAKSVPCFSHFDKSVMGQRMGRSERSVIAIKNQLLADSIKTEFCRLESIAGEG